MKSKLLFCFILTFTYLCQAVFAETSSRIFAKYPNRCFLETGSLGGDGIQRALDAGFKEVYSIELAEKYFLICKNRFQQNSNVHLYLGDSAKVLGSLLEQIHEPVTFWLDGHCMLYDTGKGETMTPIFQELEAIKKHPIKTHTILIDDIRLFVTWVFDSISLNVIVSKIKEINPDYSIVYEDGYEKNDVLVAYIPDAEF